MKADPRETDRRIHNPFRGFFRAPEWKWPKSWDVIAARESLHAIEVPIFDEGRKHIGFRLVLLDDVIQHNPPWGARVHSNLDLYHTSNNISYQREGRNPVVLEGVTLFQPEERSVRAEGHYEGKLHVFTITRNGDMVLNPKT